MELLHFNGQVWRPPYEANSQLLQVTAGCTWHRCKFCSLYNGTKFRMSPISEIEEDLKTIQRVQPRARRVFCTGANPFALSYNKLFRIAAMIRQLLCHVESIGMFARITDIMQKTENELSNLHHLKIDNITIGIESGDDDTLRYMDKGYAAKDIVEQCLKLERAGIRYNFFYLSGLAGKGKCLRNACRTIDIVNQLHPYIFGILSLTVFPDSALYEEVHNGRFTEAPERERLEEQLELVKGLNGPVNIFANHVSSPVPYTGFLPNDRARLADYLTQALECLKEADLRRYRDNVGHL